MSSATTLRKYTGNHVQQTVFQPPPDDSGSKAAMLKVWRCSADAPAFEHCRMGLLTLTLGQAKTNDAATIIRRAPATVSRTHAPRHAEP